MVVMGESMVGEFSLSSLKLKLFLLRDSAPVRKRQKRKCRHIRSCEYSLFSTSVSVEQASVCNHRILL